MLDHESKVLGAVIESGRQQLHPITAKLIAAAPESFSDSRAGLVAVTIRKMRLAGEPVTVETVGTKHLPILNFVTELAGAAASAEDGEFYAEKCWSDYQGRLVKSVADEMVGAVNAAPDRVDAIIASAIRSLDKVSKDKNADPTESIAARLAQVRFDIKNPPPLQTAVFKLTNGTTTATRGNISAIVSQAKAGKTALVSALVAAAITTKPTETDCLGFAADNPDRLPVLLLDTEQSPTDHWKIGDRIYRRAMVPESDLLHSYSLAGFSLRDLNAAIEHLLAERRWHSVFLDGTADLAADVNDSAECNALVARLHGLAIQHDTHIVNILHLNPTSETKSRGHLGSQLERKCETNLRIEKNKEGISVVYSGQNRGADIPKDTAPRFAWSTDHLMHISSGATRDVKKAASLEELRDQTREAFCIADKNALSWTDLVKSLMRVPGVKSERSAERIHTEAKAAGIIRKNLIGQWEVV